MNWNPTPLGDWLVHGVLGGGLLLLVVGVLAAAIRQPARRQRLIECGILAALLLAGLSLGPAWLTVRLPSSWAMGDPSPLVVPSAPEALPEEGGGDWIPDADEAPELSALPTDMESSLPPPFHLPDLPSEAAALNRGFGFSIQTVMTWLMAGYLVGVVSLMGHWVLGLLGLWRLLRTSLPAPPPVAHFFTALTRAGRRPRLLMSGRLRVAVSCGIWRPTVLLPAGLCAAANPAQLRWVLVHELTHLQRRDPWSCLLVGLGGAMFFWCPWYWWLRRQVRLCREYVADAAAAGQAGPAVDYAQFLLGLARGSAGPRLALGVLGRSSDLFRRVTMLLQAPLRVEKCCPRLWSLAVAAGLLGVAVFASGIGLRAADPAPNDSAPVASAAPVDDRDPARKEDPNQAPPRRSEELRRAEEALNKALQNLPTEVDAEKIRKQVQEALEKVQRDLKKLETLHQPGQGLPTVGQRLQQLSAHHSPRVGLGLQSPSPVLSEQLNLPQGQGLVIVQVVPDSPAAKAGLRVNDILLEVNGKPVPSNWREVHRLFAGEKKVDMVVLRRGKRETVKGLVLPDESEEPRPGQRFGGGFPGGPGQPGAPGGLVPGAPPAPGAPAVGGRFGLPGTPPSPRLPAGGRFAPPDPNVPAPPGLPGAPGAGPGAGFGPNMVMTTVLRNNDRFTTRHQEGSLIISVTGTVADSKAKVGEIHIQDGGRAEKYESMDKVPQRYLDKVKNLVTMSEKGGTSR